MTEMDGKEKNRHWHWLKFSGNYPVAYSAARFVTQNLQVDMCTLADQDSTQGPQKVIFTMYKHLLKQRLGKGKCESFQMKGEIQVLKLCPS